MTTHPWCREKVSYIIILFLFVNSHLWSNFHLTATDFYCGNYEVLTNNLTAVIKVTMIEGALKVFYFHEGHSGESTTTECGVNYQLLAVIY